MIYGYVRVSADGLAPSPAASRQGRIATADRCGRRILPRKAGEGDHAKHGGGGNPIDNAISILAKIPSRRHRPLDLGAVEGGDGRRPRVVEPRDLREAVALTLLRD